MFRDFEKLILTHIMHHLAVHIIHALSRDIAFEVTLLVEHRQPVGLCALKGAHNLRHGCIVAEHGSRFRHQLQSAKVVVQFRTEHHMAYLHDVDLAQQGASGINHRQHTVARTADFVNKYFHSGDLATVAGARAQVHVFEDANGVKQRKVEFLVDRVYFGQSKRREEAVD